MDTISRFMTRVLALLLSLGVIGLTAWLAFNLHPESLSGWFVLAGLVGAGLLCAVALYLGLKRATGFGAPHPERTGAGMMVGLGYRARQSDEDELDL
jgi:Na+/H+-dicarboxylate symporter